MNKQDVFESERLFYRGINELDSDCLVKWRSNPELIKYFRNPTPITRENHINWYENLYLNNLSRYDFIIIEKISNRKIGTIGVSFIDYEKDACEISYMIAEFDFQRKGFASEAILAIMSKMNEEKVCNFYVEIHKDNVASIQVCKKLGFAKSSECKDFFTIFTKSGK
jgi:RimJ/RimL family protein N-acetyltransferase